MLLLSFVALSACGAPPEPTGDAFPLQFGTEGYDGAYVLALDAAGDLLVVGSTEGVLGEEANGAFDAYIRNLGPDGEVRWTRQFGTAEGDALSDIVLDGDDRVVLAGWTEGDLDGANAGLGDLFVRVTDADFNETWTRQFGTDANERQAHVAVDGSGSVIVTGETRGDLEGVSEGGYDLFVRKYDADGENVAWTDQFGSGEHDSARDVGVDAAGNVFVVGTAQGDLGEGHHGGGDALVRKYAPDGSVLWTEQFGTSEDDYAYAAAVDTDGNVYVGGRTRGALAGEHLGISDAFVRKLDPDGDEIWTDHFGTAGSDRVEGLTVEGDQLIAVGQTEGVIAGENAGDDDVFVRRYDGAGTELGTTQFGTTEADYGWNAAVDAAGRIYVVGETEGEFDEGVGAGGFDAYVHRLDP